MANTMKPLRAIEIAVKKRNFGHKKKETKRLNRRQIYLDEMHHEMAKFYYFYGNAVLFKVWINILNFVVEKAENNKNDNDEGEDAEKEEENTQENPKIQEERWYFYNFLNNKCAILENVVFESKDAIIVDETDTKPNDSDKLNSEPIVSLNNATTENNNNENKTSNEIKNDDVDFLQVWFIFI